MFQAPVSASLISSGILFCSLFLNIICVLTIGKKGRIAPVHDMKACKGGRGIAPLILNLGIRWRWLVNIKPWPLKAGTYWVSGRVGPRDLSGRFSGERSTLLLAGIRTEDRPARSQATVLITLSPYRNDRHVFFLPFYALEYLCFQVVYEVCGDQRFWKNGRNRRVNLICSYTYMNVIFKIFLPLVPKRFNIFLSIY